MLSEKPLGSSIHDLSSEDIAARDTLRLIRYAKALTRFVQNSETPVTVGIQGDWGTGKTSLLNMVGTLVRPRRGLRIKTPVVYFNTWQHAQFQDEKYLGINILNELVKLIRSHAPEDNKKARERADKLLNYGRVAARFVGMIGNQIIQNKVGVDLATAAAGAGSGATPQAEGEDPDDLGQLAALVARYKETFADLVDEILGEDPASGEHRFVVMIDDLDRIRPARALEILEVIKNFVDVPRCVFLLAVDYSVIAQGVREKLGYDTETKSYFDKIIQVPFKMPVSSYDMENFLFELLGWNQNSKGTFVRGDNPGSYLALRDKFLESQDVAFFTNITRLSVGTNPRSIKRVVNYALLLKNVCELNRGASTDRHRKTEWVLRDAKLLYALTAMQLEWPELFAYFTTYPAPATLSQLENWEQLEAVPGIGPMFDRAGSQSDQLKSNITGFIDELKELIDVNSNGQISADEFRPVWDLMIDASLTNVKLEDSEDALKCVHERAKECAEKRGNWSEWEPVVKQFLDCFRHSDFNNRMKFRLIEAGSRFHNIIWNGKQIGSLVTTRDRPLQMYLRGELSDYPEDLHAYLEDVSNKGHFGVGDISVLIDQLPADPKISKDVLSQMKAALNLP